MTSMNIEQFADLIDRYGPSPADWPAELRDPAGRLLESSPEALTLKRQAQILAGMLEALPALPAAAGLEARIRRALPDGEPAGGDPWERLLSWLFGAFWRPALAAAFSLTLGFLLGSYQPAAKDQTLADELSLLAFTERFEDLSYEE